MENNQVKNLIERGNTDKKSNQKITGSLSDPKTINSHMKGLVKKQKIVSHDEILSRLIEEFEKINYKSLAFLRANKLQDQLDKIDPDSEKASEIRQQLDKIKLKNKHFLILTIRNVLKVAKKNRWGLCKNHSYIYLYNGEFWMNIDKESFQKFLGEAGAKMGLDEYIAEYYQFREQLFKQFLAVASLPTPEPPKDKVFINLLNGTFEISPDGSNLRPFNQSDFLTYQLPFDYDTNSKSPKFKAYLDRVLPDKEKQAVLAEFLGYVFIKHGSHFLKEEKTLILYGTGGNGKSVIFEILSALLGSENVSHYSVQSLTNENGYYRAKIGNKLLNYASEINTKLEPSIFKQLVSGEPTEARLPYGEPFTLRQYAKLIFNCNTLPKDVEHTNAYYRRFMIISFDVKIPDTEQDKELHSKIISTELSGIFNWVLAGLNRLLKQKKFSECEAIKQALENYKLESDTVRLFLDDKEYQKNPKDHILIKELYIEYRTFCYEDGYKMLNKRNFIKRLQNFEIMIERKNVGYVAYVAQELK